MEQDDYDDILGGVTLKIFDKSFYHDSGAIRFFEPISQKEILYRDNIVFISGEQKIHVKDKFEAKTIIEQFILNRFIEIKNSSFHTISIEKLLDLARIKEIIE